MSRFMAAMFLTLPFLLAACTAAPPPPAPAAKPTRVVSLDYCADQFVLKFADRRTIAALSPDATRSFSYMRADAEGMPSVRPSAEEVLALQPDLVVRSYGGGPALEAALERAGVRVHQIGWVDGFDAIRANMRAAASAVGQPARGEAAVAAFDARLAAIAPARGASALYVTSGGVTSGPDGMIGALFDAAGLTNMQTRPGWNPIPVERLAREQPQVVATAFFDGAVRGQDFWSAARHPVVTQAINSRPQARLDAATVSCGGWFAADAVEALAAAGRAAP
jgi:iron complex transport system substrate-binding protein